MSELLERGADSNLPDDPAWASPLKRAVRRRHEEVAELLKHLGAV